MAILTNSRSTFSAVGIREDLSNIIYNISPMDTPFLSMSGRGTCDNTLFEWQTDELATQAANQQLQGDVPDAWVRINRRSVSNPWQPRVLLKRWILPGDAVRKPTKWLREPRKSRETWNSC